MARRSLPPKKLRAIPRGKAPAPVTHDRYLELYFLEIARRRLAHELESLESRREKLLRIRDRLTERGRLLQQDAKVPSPRSERSRRPASVVKVRY